MVLIVYYRLQLNQFVNNCTISLDHSSRNVVLCFLGNHHIYLLVNMFLYLSCTLIRHDKIPTILTSDIFIRYSRVTDHLPRNRNTGNTRTEKECRIKIREVSIEKRRFRIRGTTGRKQERGRYLLPPSSWRDFLWPLVRTPWQGPTESEQGLRNAKPYDGGGTRRLPSRRQTQ